MIGWWARLNRNLALRRVRSFRLGRLADEESRKFRKVLSGLRFLLLAPTSSASITQERRIKRRTGSRLIVLIVTCAPLYKQSHHHPPTTTCDGFQHVSHRNGNNHLLPHRIDNKSINYVINYTSASLQWFICNLILQFCIFIKIARFLYHFLYHLDFATYCILSV